MLSFTLLPNDSLTTTTSSFIRFYCYLHTELLYELIKLQKTANDEGVCPLGEMPFLLNQPYSFDEYIQKYIFIYIYININKGHRHIQVKRALSSQSFGLTLVCQQRGVCDLAGRGSGRGLLRRLSRDHMVCVCSGAHVRACVSVSCPCDHQAGQRPRVSVSFPLSFPLSRSHFCIRATTS